MSNLSLFLVLKKKYRAVAGAYLGKLRCFRSIEKIQAGSFRWKYVRRRYSIFFKGFCGDLYIQARVRAACWQRFASPLFSCLQRVLRNRKSLIQQLSPFRQVSPTPARAAAQARVLPQTSTPSRQVARPSDKAIRRPQPSTLVQPRCS